MQSAVARILGHKVRQLDTFKLIASSYSSRWYASGSSSSSGTSSGSKSGSGGSDSAAAAAAGSDDGILVLPMPKLSPQMQEGRIARWLVKEGDAVSAYDVLLEVCALRLRVFECVSVCVRANARGRLNVFARENTMANTQPSKHPP